MQIADILSADRIVCACQATSKKSVLEQAAELLCDKNEALDANSVFDSLNERERLGSTGIGEGIAIPHSRIKDNEQTIAVFLQLQKGIDYESPDSKPVDLFFALAVPEDSTQEHLEILAHLAGMFRDEDLLTKLRSADSQEEIFQLLTA